LFVDAVTTQNEYFQTSRTRADRADFTGECPKKMVDLTHGFEKGIPYWPGFPDEKRETIYW